MSQEDWRSWQQSKGSLIRFWLDSSERLYVAFELLRHAHRGIGHTQPMLMAFHQKEFPPPIMPLNFAGLYDTEMLLLALSVENVLKALLIKRGQELMKDGKYVGPKHHDLVKLANEAKLALSDDQRAVFELLTSVSTSYGRYPVGIQPHTTPQAYQWGDRAVGSALNAMRAALDIIFDYQPPSPSE